MVKLSEGIKMLVGAVVVVLFLYVLSGKYDPIISIVGAFIAGTISWIIMENL